MTTVAFARPRTMTFAIRIGSIVNMYVICGLAYVGALTYRQAVALLPVLMLVGVAGAVVEAKFPPDDVDDYDRERTL